MLDRGRPDHRIDAAEYCANANVETVADFRALCCDVLILQSIDGGACEFKGDLRNELVKTGQRVGLSQGQALDCVRSPGQFKEPAMIRRSFKGLMSSAAFIAGMVPPDYVIDALLVRGKTYTLTGPTGHGKTLAAILMAIKVARGEWFCGKECMKGHVAFFAAENPDNVRIQFYSQCAELGIDPASLDISWHDGPFSLKGAHDAVAKALAERPDLTLCIFDSLQALFEGDDDNHNMAMLHHALNFRDLINSHKNRPSGLIIAHPVKNAARDNLLPRGGGSLLNELDGNLTCWAESNVVELHWQGKYRGIPFDPVKLETVAVKPEGLVNAKGDQLPCTVIRPLGEQREAELATDANQRRITILTAIRDNPGTTKSDVARLAGIPKSAAYRFVDELIEKRAIKSRGGKLTLTKEGDEWLA